MAQMLAAGRYIGMLNSERPADRRTKLNLPPGARREMGKMGLGAELRKLQRIITWGDRRSRALVRRSRELSSVLRSACPRLDSDLVARTVDDLLDSIYYAEQLSERLREIPRVKGRSRRGQLRLILMLVQEVELRGQRREVERLRRDIPRLLKELTPTPRKGSVRNLKNG